MAINPFIFGIFIVLIVVFAVFLVRKNNRDKKKVIKHFNKTDKTTNERDPEYDDDGKDRY